MERDRTSIGKDTKEKEGRPRGCEGIAEPMVNGNKSFRLDSLRFTICSVLPSESRTNRNLERTGHLGSGSNVFWTDVDHLRTRRDFVRADHRRVIEECDRRSLRPKKKKKIRRRRRPFEYFEEFYVSSTGTDKRTVRPRNDSGSVRIFRIVERGARRFARSKTIFRGGARRAPPETSLETSLETSFEACVNDDERNIRTRPRL